MRELFVGALRKRATTYRAVWGWRKRLARLGYRLILVVRNGARDGDTGGVEDLPIIA